jgi:hypothetical protein
LKNDLKPTTNGAEPGSFEGRNFFARNRIRPPVGSTSFKGGAAKSRLAAAAFADQTKRLARRNSEADVVDPRGRIAGCS